MNSSFKWSFIEKFGQYFVQFIISVILARLLPPEDFGSIALLNVILVISNTVVDGGFSQGLIRKLNCSSEDYNSVFWFNCIISFLLYIFLFFISGFINLIFENVNLIKQSRVLFLVIPIGSLNIIQMTIIIKDLNFKSIAMYMVVASIISGSVGVFCAFFGLGIWSLIIQILFNSVLITVFIWSRSKWKPSFSFSINPIKELFTFSSKLFAASFINNIFNNLYTFSIAKFFTPIQLGYYSQAYRFATQPTVLVDAILTRVTYPILSKLQFEKKEFFDYYRDIQINIFAIVSPLMIVLIIVADDLIPMVFGDNWLPIIPFFQILCIAAITFPIHPLCISTLKVFGLSSLIFQLELLKKIIMIFIIFATIKQGILALVIGQLAFYILILPINMYYSGKQIGYTLLSQSKDLFPFILSSILSFLLNIFIDFKVLSTSGVLGLIFKSCMFLGSYLIFIHIYDPNFLLKLLNRLRSRNL